MPDVFAAPAPVPVERYHERTRPSVFRDDANRRWSGTLEQKTMHPTGSFLPMDFRVPYRYLIPAQTYFTFSDVEVGSFTIDYDRWMGDNESAWSDYRRRIVAIAQETRGESAQSAIEAKDATLMALVGPSPMHTDFIKACKAGNSWALGKNDPNTGRPYPKGYVPKRLQGLEHTLTIYENWQGSNIDTSFDPDDFADELLGMDALPDALQETVARLDGQAKYDEFDDELTPKATRSKTGQFVPKTHK